MTEPPTPPQPQPLPDDMIPMEEDHHHQMLMDDHLQHPHFHVLKDDVLMACILLGLTGVVGLAGNGLMLRALWRYRSLRQDFYVLLGSVAVADILCLVISVPAHIIWLTRTIEPEPMDEVGVNMSDEDYMNGGSSSTADPVHDAWCKTSKYIDAGTGFVTAYHLVVLSVLRGILLTSRGRNPPTARQTLVCLVILWLIAFPAAIPFLMTVEDYKGFCHYTLDTNVERELLLLNSFSCFVPVALIGLIYLATHLIGQRYFQDSYSSKEKRMSRLVTVIVVLFALMQVPSRVMDVHVLFKEMEAQEAQMGTMQDEEPLNTLYIARNLLLCLLMFDKAARPIICAKLAPGLSDAFDEVINCTKCERRGHHNSRGRAGRSSGSQASTTTANTTVAAYAVANGAPPASSSTADAGGGGDLTPLRRNSSRDAGRHPSTSSRAPLTAEDRGEDGEVEREERGGLDLEVGGVVFQNGHAGRGRSGEEAMDEMEIVQL